MHAICPKCNLELHEQEYEGEKIMFCQACSGHWLTRSQLDTIVNKIELNFSRREAKTVLDAMTPAGSENLFADKDRPVFCPECNRQMTKERYHPNCPVKIDSCPEHAVWLDVGEIKNLQVFVEKAILGHKHA